jgi:aminoglycoside 3-N-acetyltransferase
MLGGMLLSRSHLAQQLTDLGVRRNSVAMVHCRMSALGHVIGGVETIVRALLDAIGPDGTLMAYTGWQDFPPEDLDVLDEVSRQIYFKEQPIYDPRVAAAKREHGRLAEALRTWPGAKHSFHPEAGVSALGRHAEALVAPHLLEDAYGADTPYARLVEQDGQVVLLGAPLDTVTLIHHAEAIARVDGKRRVHFRIPVLEGGERVWRSFSDIDTGDGALPYARVLGGEDYIGYLAQLALVARAGYSGPLGETTGHVFEARALVACAAAWIERNFAAAAPEI